MSNTLAFPRQPLGYFPTPVIELRRLGERLGGPRLFMKRDDHTGLGLGGNKTRKLEFLLGDALARECDTVITGGAEQSNHCRQTAAAAASCGLRCHLVLGGEPSSDPNGNLLLSQLFGAEIHWSGELRKGERIPEIAERLQKAGSKPYVIPYGGSNSLGALGFVEATRELKEQLEQLSIPVSHIVFPSSSGGTHAGLIVGSRLYDQSYQLIGIKIDKDETGEAPFEEQIISLASQTAKCHGITLDYGFSDLILRSEYVGGGYGILGDLEREAISLTAQLEGILLDPVYTGRAMGALIDMIRRREFSTDHNVLFWHTGGAPALFSYGSDVIFS